MGFWYSEEEERQAKEVQRTARERQRTVAKTNTLLAQAARGCEACPLDKEKLYHGKMLPTGASRPLVYMLGEAPGKDEDEQGEQFVGKAGRLLRKHIPEGWDKRIRWNNTLRCRPPKNRTPEPLEVECCRALQVRDIEQSKPKAIFGFGAVPLKWITRNQSLAITPWRGRMMPVQVGKHICWYFPMWHPSYINRVKEDQDRRGEELAKVFQWDLERAFALVEDGLPEPHVEPVEERRKGLVLMERPTLDGLREQLGKLKGMLGIDYETDGFRPYRKDRKILTIALSDYSTTVAFPYQHPEFNWGGKLPQVRKLMQEFLHRSDVKVAHNLGFEQEWTAEEFGPELLRSTEWGCSMAQAYVLDEREGAKELGEVTLMRLGFDVKAESTVNVKALELEPLSKVLPYNALDAKYCLAAFVTQSELIEQEGLGTQYKEQVRRVPTLVLAQRHGLVPNHEAIDELERQYTEQEEAAIKRILAHKDVAAWAKDNKFSVSSNQDWLAFLQHKFPGKVDDTQEETLEKLRYAPASLEMERRRAHKLLSTYLLPYKRGGSAVHEDGLIHTRYNPCKTTTRRLSSEDPNSQNIPIRKTPKMRSIVKVRKGRAMIKADYGQLEARVIAMASKDKTLVKQTWDGYDIHSDWTKKLAEDLEMGEVLKELGKKNPAYKSWRDTIKNGWTFPLFFGSSTLSVARNIHEAPGKTWDSSKNGRTFVLDWFRDRVEEFWGQYAGVREWQEGLQRFYNEHGYVETLTGFRRHAPMSWNELINMPIQGTASDIVVDGMNRLSELSMEEDIPDLQPILNVHDELDFDVPEKEVAEYVQVVAREMCSCKFPFINVPLSVEVSAGPDWFQQEEVGVFLSTQFK